MTTWKLEKIKKISGLKNPVLIEGLPGIGNVGKVAIDYIIEELKAEKIYEVFSYSMPHSVFVNENNLVELPTISFYYKKSNGKSPDILFLAGDVQPIDETSSYRFSEMVLDVLQEFKGKELITLGGIGLPTIPKQPKLYCTGNFAGAVKKYTQGTKIDKKLYGVVGPIIGVSGLLLGLAKRRKINAVSMLAETYGHPMYLGIRGAREIVAVLNKKLNLKINLKELDSEITEMDEEVQKRGKITDVSKRKGLKHIGKFGKEVSYIG